MTHTLETCKTYSLELMRRPIGNDSVSCGHVLLGRVESPKMHLSVQAPLWYVLEDCNSSEDPLHAFMKNNLGLPSRVGQLAALNSVVMSSTPMALISTPKILSRLSLWDIMIITNAAKWL